MRLRIALALAAAFLPFALVTAQVPTQTLLGKLEWRSIGPFVGGRAVAIAGVPSNPKLYYMGTVGGGVWKTENAGLSWTNLTDKTRAMAPSIGALAVAPSNPQIIYAGTGETDIRNDMLTGNGVFRSSDGGKTWAYAGLADTHSTSALIVSPTDPNVVYAASMGHVFVPDPNRGVYKTTDGGKTWKQILFVDNNTGAINLAMAPSQPNVLYATMWQAQRTPWSLLSGGPGSGLYKSTDGGAHWTNLTHKTGLPTGVWGRVGVGVAASSPNVVYAIIQNKAAGGVYRSNDGGRSWQHVFAGMELRQRAFYYMQIFVDPTNPNTAYVPEVDGVWATRDGGQTWAPLHPPHGDNHIVWINPKNPQILLEGNDGGATVSQDGGKTWSSEHNQPTGQFYHVNLDDQFPFHVYGAQQDEGSTEGPSAAVGGSIPTAAWQRVAYGESTWVVPQPGDPNITYGSGYFSLFMRYNLKLGQYQDISPWPNYMEGASAGELKYRFGWTHAITFSPVNPKELLIGAQYVLKSDDYGQHWTQISPDLTRNDPKTEAPTGGPVSLDQSGAETYPGLSVISVSPKDDNVIWAGSYDGLLHVTFNGGKSWQQVNPPSAPAESWYSAIEPGVNDSATAYVTTERHMWDDFRPYVYKTTDMGKTWTAITNGLPQGRNAQYANSIVQDPNDPNLLFLATNQTVYVSLNGGAHWQPLTLNLPRADVRSIALNTRQGDIVIATHGRAFWILDNLALLEQLSKSPTSAQVAVFSPDTAWLSHAYGSGGGFGGGGVSGENPPFGAVVFFHVPASYSSKTPVTLSFTNNLGQVVNTYSLHLKPAHAPKVNMATLSPSQRTALQQQRLTAITPGMNRFVWNLRYPDATEVKGFYVPAAAGGLDDSVEGPVVTPGAYTVTLNYAGQKISKPFTVKLDPRIDASQGDLNARLVLSLKIHTTLNALDTKLNQALAVQSALQAAVAKHAVPAAKADPVLINLNRTILGLVDLQEHASEGTLSYEAKLRSHLAYLVADLDLAYLHPTPAQVAVFAALSQQAAAGEQHLTTAIAAAKQLMP
ncbi:MAG: glycosyl hydrolase [Acidobacteria bacterium]|nr:MAG: glycosyl hydrolase [Acidobacteriota bacterium]